MNAPSPSMPLSEGGPGPTAKARDAARLLHGLGYLYLEAGRNSRALALLLIGQRIAPDDCGLLRALAAAFIANGAGEQALGALDRLAAIEPAPDEARHLLRARALWLVGRKGEARQAFGAFLAARNQHG